MMRDPFGRFNVERTYDPDAGRRASDDCEERSILLTVTVRKDGTAYVDGKGRHWETTGHRIILRTPAGGELEIAWPEDFAPGGDAAFAARLDAALATKDPREAVERCWALVRELRGEEA